MTYICKHNCLRKNWSWILYIFFIANQKRKHHLKILAIKFKGKAGSVKARSVTFCRTADQGTSQLCSIPCFTLINCSYHRSSNFTACFSLGLSHSYASYKQEPHIFTFSASQKSIPLPSMVSVSTVLGSCDCQFCGAGSCCSFTSWCLLIPVS